MIAGYIGRGFEACNQWGYAKIQTIRFFWVLQPVSAHRAPTDRGMFAGVERSHQSNHNHHSRKPRPVGDICKVLIVMEKCEASRRINGMKEGISGKLGNLGQGRAGPKRLLRF